MNFKHVLIITYGRTGSTLLQGLLNTIDGCIVRGENLNFCLGLYHSYQSLQVLIQEKPTDTESTQAFFGAHLVNEESFLYDARNLLKRQLSISSDTKTWGFKEIRYTPETNLKDIHGKYDLGGYLSFLEKLLPNCAFVFLTRKHSDVIDSAFWKEKNVEKALSWITDFEKQAMQWSLKKSNCIWIDYENIKQVSAGLKQLFDFLGAEFDPETVKKTLSTEHSYGNKAANIAASRENIQRDKSQLLHITTSPHPLIDLAYIDNQESGILLINNRTQSFGGVVVLNADVKNADEYKIILKLNDKDIIADWGIESPLAEKEHPKNINAKKARFKFPEVSAIISGKVLIALKVPSNPEQEIPLFNLFS